MTRSRALYALAWGVAAFTLGALAQLGFGSRPPHSAAPANGLKSEWRLPAARGAGDPTVGPAWVEVDPWNAAPVEPVDAGPPPPPPAIPVGVIRAGGRYRAVFVQNGVEQIAAAGERLHLGGRVRSVGPLEVRWIDADGQVQAREFMSDPLPAVVPSVPGTSGQ